VDRGSHRDPVRRYSGLLRSCGHRSSPDRSYPATALPYCPQPDVFRRPEPDVLVGDDSGDAVEAALDDLAMGSFFPRRGRRWPSYVNQRQMIYKYLHTTSRPKRGRSRLML